MAGVKKPVPFDPAQFALDRKSVNARKASEARISARTPAPLPKKKKTKPTTERIEVGLGTRNMISKRLVK